MYIFNNFSTLCLYNKYDSLEKPVILHVVAGAVVAAAGVATNDYGLIDEGVEIIGAGVVKGDTAPLYPNQG